MCTGHDGAAHIVALLQSRGIRPWLVLDEGGPIVTGQVPGVAAPVALVGVSEKLSVAVRCAQLFHRQRNRRFLMFLIGRLSVNESSGGHASMPPQVMRSLLPAHQYRSFSDCQQRSAISHLGRAIAKLADEPMRFIFLIWFRSRSSCSLQLQHAVLHVDARGVAAGFSSLYQNFARA